MPGYSNRGPTNSNRGLSLSDSGGGGRRARAPPPPPFEIPKRVFKRDPPKTFAPAALAVAAAPLLSPVSVRGL